MNNKSLYEGEKIVLTTKHSKEDVIEPIARDYLAAGLLVLSVDTDELGTFSGEIERQGPAQDVVKKKAEWGMNLAGYDYGVATEGSFGPNPAMPLCPSGHEIIHFIDKKRNFHLQLSELTVNTNFNMCTTDSEEKLLSFASKIGFPEHGLILRPNVQRNERLLFKGVRKEKTLMDVFDTCRKNSGDGNVLVETDMRAHMNPTRMQVIDGLASVLAKRLLSLCPECGCPGWGPAMKEERKTAEKSQMYCCVKCEHKERVA